MSRRPALVLMAVAIVAVIGLVIAAAVNRRDLAFTPGVPIIRTVTLEPRERACQTNLEVERTFRRVEFVPRAAGEPSPILNVKVVDSGSGHLLGRRLVDAGWASARPLQVEVGRVRAGRRVDVCIGNRGTESLTLGAGKVDAIPDSELFVADHKVDGTAVALRFMRGRPRSVLSQVPVIFRRAAIFRPDLVGPWTFWVLAGLVMVAVPALLTLALADATRQPDD